MKKQISKNVYVNVTYEFIIKKQISENVYVNVTYMRVYDDRIVG
jgi:hypothetical protein